jgi:hypothetical protein
MNKYGDNVNQKIYSLVYWLVGGRVGNRLWSQVKARAWDRINWQVRNRVWGQVSNRVWIHLRGPHE